MWYGSNEQLQNSWPDLIFSTDDITEVLNLWAKIDAAGTEDIFIMDAAKLIIKDQNMWKCETSVRRVKEGAKTSRYKITCCHLLSLTLIGLSVPSNQVLQFKAVGSHLLLRLAANSCHVAVLHLTGAAAGPGVDAHSERLAWKAEGEEMCLKWCFHTEKMKTKANLHVKTHIIILKDNKWLTYGSMRHLSSNLIYTYTHEHKHRHIAGIAIVHLESCYY